MPRSPSLRESYTRRAQACRDDFDEAIVHIEMARRLFDKALNNDSLGDRGTASKRLACARDQIVNANLILTPLHEIVAAIEQGYRT